MITSPGVREPRYSSAWVELKGLNRGWLEHSLGPPSHIVLFLLRSSSVLIFQPEVPVSPVVVIRLSVWPPQRVFAHREFANEVFAVEL